MNQKKKWNTVRRICVLTAMLAGLMGMTAHAKTKVACIGDSLTYGFQLKASESYPSQLQQLLGIDYEVRNFGLSSSCVIDDGALEYKTTDTYAAALQYDADVLIFMFGTNDVTAYDFTPLYFQNQYRELADSFRTGGKQPKIYIIVPPDSFDLHFGLTRQTEQPIRLLGQQLPATVIDPYNLFIGHPEDYLEDGLHLTASAYGKLAKLVYRAMTGDAAVVEAPAETISETVKIETKALQQQAEQYQAAERAAYAGALQELKTKYPDYETTGLWTAHGVHI